MNALRVLVVEDSVTVRKRLCEVLTADPEIQVVGEAENGRRAIELCAALRPDVVTLDMMLPEMSGLAATEYIMAHHPTPILVVSSSTNRGELFKTYQALAAGALDVMEKPSGDDADADWDERFIRTVKLIARVRVITHPRGRLDGRMTPTAAHVRIGATEPRLARVRLVALGASTGGPAAIRQVLRDLPAEFPVPILVVLHIAIPFGAAFADWLDEQTPHRVRFARDAQSLDDRGVFLAPPGQHLIVQGNLLRLSDEPERFSCKPSVDVLFESVARECAGAAIACLLTGMGRDGARGLLQIREAGGFTLAQDEATSAVYGMPREAALLNAARSIVPLHQVGASIAAAIRNVEPARPK